jgi:hypothetical protein
MRKSAILDRSQFETAASERRFMLAFLEALYRRSTGEPVHLIFDEADLWAPERIIDKEGVSAKLHGVMQTVVRRGRASRPGRRRRLYEADNGSSVDEAAGSKWLHLNTPEMRQGAPG